ncbi:sulfurtransferase TusA family protein [Caballeronia sp. ATUFL_M1_KS5A]|uniref:sulfurtransferase TusA family protein n=1 Tax=Caballeronia sp. ATUFL_M1_KS5A TaxID=2921778 RepID=UPI00202907AC|nr:sulfurtransferase TusA family protein [Caballeronia sp. ATUFL_M1_KS5A]
MQPTETDTFDAGDMSCGELLLALRKRLRAMPGQTLKLVTRDAGAYEDIPAFCRITGHELRHHDAQVWWIRARG